MWCMHAQSLVLILKLFCRAGSLPGHFGCVVPGFGAFVDPEVGGCRENKRCEGVADGALYGVDGVKEWKDQRKEPDEQRCSNGTDIKSSHLIIITGRQTQSPRP